MYVCRSLLLIALCLFTQAVLDGQVLPSSAVLASSQAIASSAQPSERDALPESPLPAQNSFTYPARLISNDRLPGRPQDIYGSRLSDEYGRFVSPSVSPEGLSDISESTVGDLFCNCDRGIGKNKPAMRVTFTTYDRDGRPTPDVPEVAGSYRSEIASTSWYPHRLYGPFVEGIRFSQQEMGEIFTGNLFEGFTSNVKHVLHLGSSPPAR